MIWGRTAHNPVNPDAATQRFTINLPSSSDKGACKMSNYFKLFELKLKKHFPLRLAGPLKQRPHRCSTDIGNGQITALFTIVTERQL